MMVVIFVLIWLKISIKRTKRKYLILTCRLLYALSLNDLLYPFLPLQILQEIFLFILMLYLKVKIDYDADKVYGFISDEPKLFAQSKQHIKANQEDEFFKILRKECGCFKYLCYQFPALSGANLKDGVFVGPDITKMIKWEIFQTEMDT